MKVLIIIDVWGWAFEFVARGIQKYSKHDCTIKRYTEIGPEDVNSNYDCLFCLNDSVWNAMRTQQKFVENIPKKCVGIRGEQMPSDRILKGWTIGAVNKRIYDKLISEKDALPVKGIYLTRNGVDVEIFKPVERPDFRFVVGWAGNPTQPLKRFHLLHQIYYPMKVTANWGRQFFIKNRGREEMVNFYSDIDVFINVSSHEGMPQSILEAASTKLPMVVTDTGGMPDFVHKDWVVPMDPESVVISNMNQKLRELKENVNLRKRVGEQNYRNILENWTWQKVVKDYDLMFEEA